MMLSEHDSDKLLYLLQKIREDENQKHRKNLVDKAVLIIKKAKRRNHEQNTSCHTVPCKRSPGE